MQTPRLTSRLIRFGWIGLLVLLLTACHQDMYDQQKYTTYEPSSFFADGRSSRPNVPGTTPYEVVKTDEFLYTGLIDGKEVDAMPFPVTKDLLLRGQLKYNIYCAVCHGESGYGASMVAERGGIVPANFHQQRLREAPLSHFFVIITNGVYRGDPDNGGYQSMYGYASRITPEDRWAIAAYIRALQLSQNATIDDVPPAERARLGN
ncbi:cytochrome c [Chloroflexus sp.]|uniref:c-type cytochrome n=1 Tax=Chloroflexus sp. TaxID=1904827 RepID=UPI00298F0BF0|nr:cytochrome c [Chloroflexus sp.]MCS6888262.1 cytochrome c [Chloroflexus sp.]MCX7859602.1 cytochrome c [Chloroflexus sp.]MDW8402699.1 cytochrome c [Chloroflexus sp.]